MRAGPIRGSSCLPITWLYPATARSDRTKRADTVVDADSDKFGEVRGRDGLRPAAIRLVSITQVCTKGVLPALARGRRAIQPRTPSRLYGPSGLWRASVSSVQVG